MTTAEKCLLYKKKAEKLQRQIEQARGALKQELRKQKENLGCSSNKEAKEKLKDLKHYLMEISMDLEQALDKWEKENAELLTSN